MRDVCLRAIMAPREAFAANGTALRSNVWRSLIAISNTSLLDNYASEDGGALYLKLHARSCAGDVGLSIGNGTRFVGNRAAGNGKRGGCKDWYKV